jgi:hypothetical protein
MDYQPDRWVVIKITTPKEHLYKVFACWSGGYGGGDSWKMNSGITRATLVDNRWEFDGYSGSVYSCHREAYGTNGYGNTVLQNFIDQMPSQGATMEIMPGDTDWTTLDYDPLQQWIESGIAREKTE